MRLKNILNCNTIGQFQKFSFLPTLIIESVDSIEFQKFIFDLI